MKRWYRFALLLLSVNSAYAGTSPFLITNRTSDLNAGDPIQGPILNALNAAADTLQTTINTGFLAQTLRQGFADDLAKANTSPTAGFIVDRASNFTKFSVGGGAQGGFFWQGSATSSNANNQIPQLGAGAQAAIVAGIHGDLFSSSSFARRLGIFVSAMGGGTTISSVSANILNLGVNFQYDLLSPRSVMVLGWNGLKFVTGINYAMNSVSYSGKIKQSTSATVSGQTANIAVDMTYAIGAKTNDIFVPLELSTGLQILYFLSVYGGGAADLNFGSSTLTGTGTGPLNATASTNVGVGNLFSGVANLNLDDGTVGHPTVVTLRGFAGVQFNFWALRVDLQAAALNNGSKAGSLIVRLAL